MKNILNILILSITFNTFIFSNGIYNSVSEKISKDLMKNSIKSLNFDDFINENNIPKEDINYIYNKLFSNIKENTNILINENTKPEAFLSAQISSSEVGYKVFIKIKDYSKEKIILNYKFLVLTSMKIPGMNDDFKVELPKKTFKDALTDFDRETCGDKYKNLFKLQKEFNNIKAKFWAIQLKNSSFSLKSLKRNPGSEIKDTFLKKDFYEKLQIYHYQNDLSLSIEEENNLKELTNKETAYINDCGL